MWQEVSSLFATVLKTTEPNMSVSTGFPLGNMNKIMIERSSAAGFPEGQVGGKDSKVFFQK